MHFDVLLTCKRDYSVASVNYTSQKSQGFPTNISDKELPDKFCKFFIEKIQKVQESSNLVLMMTWQAAPPPDVQLQALKPAIQEGIRSIILSSRTKSYSLDRLPTFLLKSFVDDFLPIITIINASLIHIYRFTIVQEWLLRCSKNHSGCWWHKELLSFVKSQFHT